MLKPPKKVGPPREIAKKYGRSVFFQDYQMPDGNVEEFFISEANTTPTIGMAVTADNQVILIRQFRYAVNDFIDEFPGGNPKPGQSFEDAFRMEVLEETGYECGTVIQLGDPIAFEPLWYGTRFVPFLATGCVFRKDPELEPGENLEVVRVPLAEFMDKALHRGLIRDSKTLAITLLALPHLGYHI
jgi:ADP-ribose pyrophosphatase